VRLQHGRLPFWIPAGQSHQRKEEYNIGWRELDNKTSREVLRKYLKKNRKPVFEAKAGSLTYRMSQTTDLFTMRMESYRSKARQSAMSIATAYKRKADKVHPVNSSTPDGTVLGGIMEWREVALRRQKASIRGLPLGPYDHFLEPRYTKLARGARLKPERLERMIVGDIRPRE
jgi:hypothetical protein